MDGFQKIDRGLKIYYEQLGRHDYENDDKIGMFLAYCNDNGLDLEDIEDELSVEDPADCMYVEFDIDNFPFETTIETDEQKPKIIFEIIKQCYYNGQPTIKPQQLNILQNEISHWILQLTDDEYKIYKDIYTKQCSVMASLKNSNKDQTFWYGLCIGIKNNFPFLQYLTCIYMRDSTENSLQSAENDNEDDLKTDYLSQWINKYKNYFINMNNSNQRVNIPIIDNDDKSKQQDQGQTPTISEFIQSAINSYLYRLSPPLILPTSSGLIQDEIQDIADCIVAVSNFAKPTFFDALKCPFQIDFVIALNDVTPSDCSDDSDSDEKETDEKAGLVDWVGDISNNLRANKCVYYVNPPSELKYTSERFNSAFCEFVVQMKQKYKGIDPKYMVDYPQKRRFIAFFDRRENICRINGSNIEKIENENLNSLTFFEPTSDVRDFPNYKQYQKVITVPEWYLESTQKCLIPSKEYPKSPLVPVTDDRYNLLKTKSALTACDGKLLTFSFHVEAENKVRCYMWWRGACLLFLPQDITDLLPKIFENEDNFVFKGYDVCSWRDEQFERIFQNVTTKDPIESLRKYQ
eukprot:303308_1